MSGTKGFHTQDASESQLHRHGTLLSTHPAHNTTEQLCALLGDSNSRLKRGAAAPQSLDLDTLVKAPEVPLEQAKFRARVEVDIQLSSDILVQGCPMRGNFKLRIRKTSTKDSEIWLSGPKIRIIGYETVGRQRHIFFQFSAMLPDDLFSVAFLRNHADKGYFAAREGVHVIPFDMCVASAIEYGGPKGTFQHSTCSVQYIAIASVNVKILKKRSIAHFYRHCQVLPRLNPAAVLVPLETPVQSESAPRPSDSDDTALTVALSRTTWVAGQECHVQLLIVNRSKKDIKSIVLNLIRTIYLYKPCSDGSEDIKTTTTKTVAQSLLSMAQPSSRGHASAKGWWTGVPSGRSQEFVHYLTIPLDARTIPRGRLMEVQYEIQASLPSGICASVPIILVNFLSLDPPTPFEMGRITASQPSYLYQPGSLPPSAHSSRPPSPSDLDTNSFEDVPKTGDRLSDIPEDDDMDALVRDTIVDDDQEEALPITSNFPGSHEALNSTQTPDPEDSRESRLVEFYGPRSNSPSKTVVRRPVNSLRGHSFQERVRQKIDERRRSLIELQQQDQSLQMEHTESPERSTSMSSRPSSPSKPDRNYGYFDSIYSSSSLSHLTRSDMKASSSACSRMGSMSRPLPQPPQSSEFHGVQIPMSHSAAIVASLDQEVTKTVETEHSPTGPQHEPPISPTKSVREKIQEMEDRMRNEVY